jgi:hypothetical protein
MTVREFMLKKYPTNEWMDCPVPKHHWETIQEYADKYHEAKVKNLSSNTLLADRLPNAEDVKRWYQLLVGKSEEAMHKDIEATLR